MRHDATDHAYIIPFKRFTWGYLFDAECSRWWPYFILRLPGRAFEYSLYRNAYCWCYPVLLWSRLGNHGFELRYTPIEE